jgi:hypothetical protein
MASFPAWTQCKVVQDCRLKQRFCSWILLFCTPRPAFSKIGLENIFVITFLAHITNLFQILDLAFFGVFEKLTATQVGEFDDDSANIQITKLVQADEQLAASSTIRGSFRKVGMDMNVMKQPLKI